MHHRVRHFFAMCTLELLGSSGASSSIAGCHLLTVKATVGRRASRFELRASSDRASPAAFQFRWCCSASWWCGWGWRWRSFATTSLWFLIFMILLFNGSFVGLHYEHEYVSGFQFSYRRVYISLSLTNVCLILFYFIYFFLVYHGRQFWGHVAQLNLYPWSAVLFNLSFWW